MISLWKVAEHFRDPVLYLSHIALLSCSATLLYPLRTSEIRLAYQIVL